MQKLTLSHPQNAVIAESLPNRTLAELGKLSLMFTVRLESNLAGWPISRRLWNNLIATLGPVL
jgi:hypothetical protein